MSKLVLEGIRAKYPYGYYLTGMWKPHVCPGTLGVRIKRGDFSLLFWADFVCGGEFHQEKIPLAYWLPIPQRCLEDAPLEEAILAITNKKILRHFEQKKREIDEIGEESDKVEAGIEYLSSICKSEEKALQALAAAYNRDKIVQFNLKYDFDRLENHDFNAQDFDSWGWSKFKDAVFCLAPFFS